MSIEGGRKQEHTGTFSVALQLEAGILTLDNKDIVKIYFIEDIFSFSMVGKIQFFDNIGLMEYGPITGNEKLILAYGEEENWELVFDIFKISRVVQMSGPESGTMNMIEILFVDEMFLSLTQKKYSKSWKDEYISDIVEDISMNMLEIRLKQIERTNEKLPYFYIPYWTASTAINWLIKRASSFVTDTAGYLFYNNIEGTNFVTLEKLLQQTQILKLSEEDTGEYHFEDINMFMYNKILGWSISGIDNLSLKELKGGHKLGYDFTKKELLEPSFEYSTSIKNFTLLGQKSLFKDVSDNTVDYSLEGENDIKILSNLFHNDFIKRYCMQQCINIMVRGHERRYAGAMIEVKWPSAFLKEEHYNKNMQGLYLIKSITHQFSGRAQPYYQQKLVCMKPAYNESDYKELVSATKKNLGGTSNKMGR